jgi:geranylgeranyl diphosphate synthase type II
VEPVTADPLSGDPATGADVLADTIAVLSQRAPAIIAAAAGELRAIRLGLRFGDGSTAALSADAGRLLVVVPDAEPDAAVVEVHFDTRAMNGVFDLQRHPVEELLPESFDIRGERDATLATWRAFRLLSQRGSGLRAVQNLWRSYREQLPHLWGVPDDLPEQRPPAQEENAPSLPSPRLTGWSALDYLDERHPPGDGVGSLMGGTLAARPRTLWDGRKSSSWWEGLLNADADLLEVMVACRQRVNEEMMRVVPDRDPGPQLYDLMRDYPSRQGKGLRPTLTLAACAAFGGRAEDAVRMATALELFHNGFLVHDDIADESTHRRGRPTLNESHGAGLAVNTGDGLNLLAIDAVLSNLGSLGIARTLGLIHETMHMCRETVEGQAIELGWIRENLVPEPDDAYFMMSTKKTGWYTCISPCRIGAVCAGETDPIVLDRFNDPFRQIGIAFQIQDDLLNLLGEEELYGKEPLGDLLEGKRTVMLIHLFRTVRGAEAEELHSVLCLARRDKRFEHAEQLLDAMHRHGSIEYATGVAERLARQGTDQFEENLAFLPESEAKGVLRQIAHYVTTRPL